MAKKPKIIIRIKLSIIILIGLSFLSTANAQWTAYKRIENKNKQGHVLRFDTGTRNTLDAWFILKKETPGAFKSKLPLYKVDNNDVHDLKLAEKKQISENRWIKWQISSNNNPPSGELLEIMNGKEIVFQYYLPDGTIKETNFSLEDAREAIVELLK